MWLCGFAGLRVCGFAGRAGSVATHRGSAFCSCPPAFGLLLYLTKNTPPPRRSTPGLPADDIRWGRSPRSGLLVWAASGLRGRDAARGQPAHTPSGLTRTSHRDADPTSRDRRGRTSPCQRRHHRANGVSSRAQWEDPCRRTVVILRVVAGSMLTNDSVSGVDPATARRMTGRCRSSVTKSSAGIPIRDSRQARRRVNEPAAGIVAASTARRCQDHLTNSRTSSPANVVRGQVSRD